MQCNLHDYVQFENGHIYFPKRHANEQTFARIDDDIEGLVVDGIQA